MMIGCTSWSFNLLSAHGHGKTSCLEMYVGRVCRVMDAGAWRGFSANGCMDGHRLLGYLGILLRSRWMQISTYKNYSSLLHTE